MWSWFKLNNLGLALGTNLKFSTTVAKVLKLKVRKFWGLSPTFVEVTGEKLVRGPFCHSPPILNRVNTYKHHHTEALFILVYVRPCLDVDLFMTYLCDLFFFFNLIVINQIISLK